METYVVILIHSFKVKNQDALSDVSLIDDIEKVFKSEKAPRFG
jgi:hypothetical protein